MTHTFEHLVVLNVRMLRPMARATGAFAAIVVLMIAFSRDTSVALGFTVMLPTMLSMYVLPNRNNPAATRLFGTLPVTREQAVTAQFVIIAALCASGGLVVVPMAGLGRQPLPIAVSSLIGAVIAAALAVMLAISAPLAYHGGFGALAAYAPMLAVFVGAGLFTVSGATTALPRLLPQIVAQAWLASAALVAFGAAMLVASCAISCRVFARRDL